MGAFPSRAWRPPLAAPRPLAPSPRWHSAPAALPQWVTLVLFVLISGPLGWAVLLFLCTAAALLVVVNMKLIGITRWVVCVHGWVDVCQARCWAGAW